MITYFKKLGLEDKEAEIYLACLKNEQNSPASLVEHTGIKRSTIYFYLDKLKQKGLISYKVIKRKKYIITPKPEKALDDFIASEEKRIKTSRKAVKRITPLLKKLHKENKTNYKTSYYEGKQALRLIIDKMMEEKNDIYWIGTMEHLLMVMSEKEFYRKVTLKRMRYGTTLYTITDKDAYKSKRFGDTLGKFRKFKFFDEPYDIPATLVLFGDTIALGSIANNNIRMVMIEDALMAKFIHFIFQNLWKRMD